ncbi:MAG: exo-alpha-sialidase, partial [Bacteroidales bacterium]|nr:exo-alpha-sialidase [Bacteroidales bacterium]
MTNMRNLIISLALTSLPALSAAGVQQADTGCIVRSEFIYRGEDVPFPSCHASTIEEIPGGLIASWFGGTAERNPDVGIWTSRFTGGKWSAPVEVANGVRDGGRYPTWNPVLFNSGRQLLLFYKVGPSPSTWWGELLRSDDNGNSWSKSERLPDSILGPIKNKPLLLSDGTLICPSSSEDKGWRVHMEYTDRHATSWTKSAYLNGKEVRVIQPSILLHGQGKLQMLCRSGSSVILTSFSEDYGRSWTPMVSSGLPNPNSGIDAVTLADGRQLLVYNHLKKGRNVLNLAVSADGKTWKEAAVFENDSPGSEFSYPAIIQAADGMV